MNRALKGLGAVASRLEFRKTIEAVKAVLTHPTTKVAIEKCGHAAKVAAQRAACELVTLVIDHVNPERSKQRTHEEK